jgi:hypothetical protein
MWKVGTYSKRQRKRKGSGKPDVYQYGNLPGPFRVQVVHIWRTALGTWNTYDALGIARFTGEHWQTIRNHLTREYGIFSLHKDANDSYEECVKFLLETDTDRALDIIDLTFSLINSSVRGLSEDQRKEVGIEQDPDDAIEELNHRFREHGIGYEFTGGKLIRVDSQYVHAEVTRPAISLLQDVEFTGASDEFLRAHEHYRKKRYKEAVAEALKAFESTMKSICDARKWHYADATAKTLIKILIENGLIPSYLESHFGGLRSAMESGLPTIRDKTAGHGQGPKPTAIPEHFAAYALNLAAANIVFLVKSYKTLK